MSFKITITQLDSKKKERIIDVKICETRDEAEKFIKECKSLPKEYKPTSSDKFHELCIID